MERSRRAGSRLACTVAAVHPCRRRAVACESRWGQGSTWMRGERVLRRCDASSPAIGGLIDLQRDQHSEAGPRSRLTNASKQSPIGRAEGRFYDGQAGQSRLRDAPAKKATARPRLARCWLYARERTVPTAIAGRPDASQCESPARRHSDRECASPSGRLRPAPALECTRRHKSIAPCRRRSA
jgi:hypothetical protein